MQHNAALCVSSQKLVASKRMKIENVESDLGNKILKHLVKEEGWRIQSQYDPTAFDKGVDFDSYAIKKGGKELSFEWSNWFEWEITGDTEMLKLLAKSNKLKLIE